MNLVQVFNGKFGKIRAVEIEDNVLFVAKDVANALAYSKVENVYCKLDDDEKITLSYNDLRFSTVDFKTLGFSSNVVRITFVNESGLYNAIFGSRMPQAKAFRKWITSEVIPSIRKYGIYSSTKECGTDLLLQKYIDMYHDVKNKCLQMKKNNEDNIDEIRKLREQISKYKKVIMEII